MPTLTLTAGASFDRIDDSLRRRRRASTRSSASSGGRRRTRRCERPPSRRCSARLTTSTQNAQPRLEPVQVAGFTQLLFGGRGDRSDGAGPRHRAGAVADALRRLASRLARHGAHGEQTAGRRLGDTMHVDLRERAQHATSIGCRSSSSASARVTSTAATAASRIELLGYSDMKTRAAAARGALLRARRASRSARARRCVQQEGMFQSGLPPRRSSRRRSRSGEDRFFGRRRVRRLPLAEAPRPAVSERRQLARRELPASRISIRRIRVCFPNVSISLPIHASIRLSSGNAIPKPQQVSCQALQFLGASPFRRIITTR